MTADLSAAIAALTAELDDRPGATDDVHPILSHLTIGHLRALADAFKAPYVPGMRSAHHAEWCMGSDAPSALLSVWQGNQYDVAEEHYFVAVQS